MESRALVPELILLSLGLHAPEGRSEAFPRGQSLLSPFDSAERVPAEHSVLDVAQSRCSGCPGEAPLLWQLWSQNLIILRQSKTVHYEAPFMYLVFGQSRALLLDTGAEADTPAFALRPTVERLLRDHYGQQREAIELVVAHSHGHSDHRGGDAEFLGQPGTRLIRSDEAVQCFGIKNWPTDIGSLDLGDRSLAVIPIPGHEGLDIAVYDAASEILFAGDSLLPGRIYIRNWPLFRQSLDRLVDFLRDKPLTFILGAHIELGLGGLEYPAGTLRQDKEVPLLLRKSDLLLLHARVKALEAQPRREVHSNFILVPVQG